MTTLNDLELEELLDRTLREVETAPTLAEAQARYRKAWNLKKEAVRRNAAPKQVALLFVTVGTQTDGPALAVIASPARHVAFVVSEQSAHLIGEIRDRISGLGKRSSRIVVGDGKQPALIYQKVYDEWRDRGRPEPLAADITGGFKTMSVGVALALSVLPRPDIRYLEATHKRVAFPGDEQWGFVWGERLLRLENPYDEFGDLKRRTADELWSGGHFRAAAEAYSELAEKVAAPRPFEFRADLTHAYYAIESLDLRTATERLDRLVKTLGRFRKHPQLRTDALVTARHRVRQNAEGAARLSRLVSLARIGSSETLDPSLSREALCSEDCLDLLAMLLESANRRIELGQYDISALLSYRAQELIAQRRLSLSCDVSVGAVSDDDWSRLARRAGLKSVEELINAYNEGVGDESHYLDPDRPPRRLARAPAFRLLQVVADEISEGEDFSRFSGIGKARNASLLAHGLRLVERKRAVTLEREAERIFERLLEIEVVDEDARHELRNRHRFIRPRSETQTQRATG